MPKFSVEVPHELSRDVAVERLRGFANSVKKDIPGQVSEVNESWDEQGNLSFSFVAMGFSIAGNVVTSASAVAVQGTMPFIALPFRGAIETQIADKIKEAIG